MKKSLIFIALVLVFSLSAAAQQVQNIPTPSVTGGAVVATCGTPPAGYPTTGVGAQTVDVNGVTCSSAVISGSVTVIGATTSGVYIWTGAAWTQLLGDGTNGAFVNVKTSVLPTLAATSTKQSDGSQKTQIVDGSANVVGTTANALDVNIKSGGVVSVVTINTAATGAVTVTGALTATVDTTGLATSAKQDTGNTSLSTIKTNTDTLVAAGGGGYVRQDSTATIAKESGGNLATVKTNLDPLVTGGGGGYIRQDSNATIAKESGGNLATVATDVAPLVASGGGGYIRQDSTATIAKESGGNLASIKTNSDTLATAYAATSGCYVKSGTGTLADTTNHANCKSSAGSFYGFRAINTSGTIAYLRMYNTSSDPTCSSSTGFIESIPIPADISNSGGAGAIDSTVLPIAYSTGISYCVNSAGANNSSGAPPAGVFITLKYK